MAVSFGSNTAARLAIESIGRSSQALESVYERLSSGQRINRASDDAAGLSVAVSLNAKARIYSQASKNINDGVSYLQIADGATSDLKSILFRIKELAEQSSNGSYGDTQRQALDRETQALQTEYNRIIDVTKFNGTAVFTNSVLSIQAGIGAGAVLNTTLANFSSVTVGDGTFQAPFSTTAGPFGGNRGQITDLNGDGFNDLINNLTEVRLGNGDGTFRAVVTNNSGGTGDFALADINGDGKLDYAAATGAANVVVKLGLGTGTFQSSVTFSDAGGNTTDVTFGDLNGDGKLDLVSGSGVGSTVSVYLGNGDGTFQTSVSIGVGLGVRNVITSDLNGDGKLDIVSADTSGNTVSVLRGNGDGTFQARVSYSVSGPSGVVAADFTGDGRLDLAVGSTGGIQLLRNNGDGTFQTAVSFSAGSNIFDLVGSDFNADGKLDVAAVDQVNDELYVLLGNGNGTFGARTTYTLGNGAYQSVAAGDLNGDGAVDLVALDISNRMHNILLANGTTTTTAIGITRMSDISVATRSSALSALGQADTYFDNVNTVTGLVGAALKRFESASRIVNTTVEVSEAAKSRILDADIADESGKLIRNNILQQVGAAVLGQANQIPQIALSLLRS